MSDGRDLLYGLAVFASLGGAYYLFGGEEKATPAAASIEMPLPIRPTGLIYAATDKNSGLWQIDADSVSGPREKRQAWVIVDSSKDKTTLARSSKSLYLIDCNTTATRILKTLIYNAKGDVVASSTGKPSDDPDYYAPDSIGNAIVRNACEAGFD